MRVETHKSERGFPAEARNDRLMRAAQEFEAQMMKELLRPLTAEGLSRDDADTASGGALADFAADALGRSISARGGLGIATSIVRSLSQSETAPESVTNSGTLRLQSR